MSEGRLTVDDVRGGSSPGARVVRTPRSAFGTIVWLFVLALCGAGLYLTWGLSNAHRDVGDEQSLLSRVCSPEGSETWNCDQVLQSEYADIEVRLPPVPNDARWYAPMRWVDAWFVWTFGPPALTRTGDRIFTISVAWMGLAYFGFAAVWFLFVGQPSYARRGWHLVPLMVIAMGVAGSVAFVVLMYIVLPVKCPLCMATHVTNALLLIGTILLWPRRRAVRPGVAYVPRPHWKQVLTTVVLAVCVMQMLVVSQSRAGAEQTIAACRAELQKYTENPFIQREYAFQQLRGSAPVPVPVGEDEPVWGDRRAKRTLVMFSDFQCPHCKALHDKILDNWSAFESMAAEQGGLRFVFKHYPLHVSCNRRSRTRLHAYACDAARAVEAARIVGGDAAFWKMVDLLYERQHELQYAPYVKLAGELGLDEERFRQAMASKEAADRVARHVAEGAVAGMSGTPGLYLDGVPVQQFGAAGPVTWAEVLRMQPWPPAGRNRGTAPATQPAR